MKSKAKPAKGSARTKRFDRGGTVAALAGLGTLAYLMSRKKKGEDQGSVTTTGVDAGIDEGNKPKPKPDVVRTSEDPNAARAVENRRQDYFKTHQKYFGGNLSKDDKGNYKVEAGKGGTAGTIIDPTQTHTATTRTAEEMRSNISGDYTPQVRVQTAPQSTETVQGVNEKDLDRLQRRDVPSGGKKKSAPAKKSSADDVIAAGQRYARIGERDKPYPEKAAAAKKAANANVTALTPTDKEIRDTKAKQSGAIQAEERRRKGQGLTPYAPSGAGEVRRKEKFHQEAASGRGIKKGGVVKKYASGGAVSSASKRADGIAQRGKTRGKVC